MPDRKCVIIGAGITGMAASVILAENGCDVTLIEKSSNLGPLLRGFHRNGHYFDTGFHLARGLEKGGPLWGWFKALHLDLPMEECRPVKEIACIGQAKYPLPEDFDDIRKHFRGEEKAFEKFCSDSRFLMRKSPFLSAKSTGEFSPFIIAKKPLLGYFYGLGMGELLRRTLQGRCMLFGVSPAQSAVEDFFLMSGDGCRSSRTVPGGGKAIVQAFEKRLGQLGVSMILGHAATGINVQGSRVRSVKIESGDTVDCDIVIYTGNPAILRKILKKGVLRPAWFTHVEGIASTPMPYISFGTCTDTLPDNHVWYINSERELFGMLEEDRPSMCVMTGQNMGDGSKPCYVMGLTMDSGKIRDSEKHAFFALPELQNGWRPLGILDGDGMRRHIWGSDGSIFGYAHTYDMLPVFPITKLNGLFLAGQNIQLPGLLGCIISAAIVSGMIVGVENVLREFSKCIGES